MGFHTPLRWLLSAAAGLSILAPVGAALAESSFQVSVNFPPPPSGQGGPSRTAGGGVRGDLCFVPAEGVTPSVVIAPADNQLTTVDETPIFYVYLPKNNAPVIELAIFDADFNEYYKQIPLPAELRTAMAAGPMLLEVVVDDFTLAADEVYEWYLALRCDLDDPTSYVQQLGGTIQRLESSEALEVAITAADSPLTEANAYADARIWNETVAAVLSMRGDRPEEWEQLIRSSFDPSEDKRLEIVNLEDLFNAPLQVLTLELELQE
ncbi:MAG: DUF928 domain-containing protein [Spirulinaceae cyanobacterium SM2_1_0]|nr:DUF928 domain-containing protein [Spirulinaceae cyanobacterium SM2_1_0]